MERTPVRRLAVALVACLLVSATFAPVVAGTGAAPASRAADPATTRTAATPHGGLHIDFTTALTPDRPGEVDVAAGFDIPDGVTSLTAEVPEGVEVTATDGFSQRGPRSYEWTRTTDQPTLSYRMPANETVTRGREGAETSGFLYVDTGEWALVEAPRVGVTYSGAGQRQPIRTSQSVAGAGVAGDSILFLGPVETVSRETANQGIRLAVPAAADLRESRSDILDALAGTATDTTLGPADDEILAIAAPTEGVSYGSTGLQRGDADLWVRDVQRLDTPENVWGHEYVHTRQTYRATAETRWSYEGMADYYAAARALRTGRINYSQYRRHLRIGTRPRYANVTLADPDTWRGTTANYWKGALVFAAVDRQIRIGSDGRATLQDAIRRAQDRADGGPLNQSTFLGSVEAVGGSEARETARRFTETDATPETWNRSEHARVFGGLASIDYRFDGFAVEGPYRSASVDRLPTLVPGERVAVRATAENTGDAAGDFAVTLRRGDRAVATRSGRLDAGASTDLRWTVPFDAPADTSLLLAEATRSVTVRPAATPSVTELRVPARADVGESVPVRATVANPAGRPADDTVAVTADGRTVVSEQVQLAPDETVTLSGTTAFDSPGEYTVAAGDRSTTVTVRAATPTPTPTPVDRANRDGPTATDGGERRGTDGTAGTATAGAGGGGGSGGGTATDGTAAGGTGGGGGAGSADTAGTASPTPVTPTGASGDGFGVAAVLLGGLLATLVALRRRG